MIASYGSAAEKKTILESFSLLFHFIATKYNHLSTNVTYPEMYNNHASPTPVLGSRCAPWWHLLALPWHSSQSENQSHNYTNYFPVTVIVHVPFHGHSITLNSEAFHFRRFEFYNMLCCGCITLKVTGTVNLLEKFDLTADNVKLNIFLNAMLACHNKFRLHCRYYTELVLQRLDTI